MTDYIEVEHEGRIVRQYPDGSLREPNGYWVTKHPGGAPTIDSELSPAYNARRWELERTRQAQQREDTQRAFQRALVSQVPGAKTLDGAVEQLAGSLVAELATDGAVKEHGIKNWVGGSDWALKHAGLIKEKENEPTVNIDKAVFLAPGTREHVAGLLQSLVASDEDGDV